MRVYAFVLAMATDLLVCAHDFVLEANPTSVRAMQTPNVTLTCSYNTSANSELIQVSDIRLVKQHGNVSTKIAEVRENDAVIYSVPDGIPSGTVGNARSSYLQIFWALASNETFGTYRCEIVGLNQLQELIIERTESVKITVHNLTSEEILEIITHEKDAIENQFEQYKKDMDAKFADLLKLVADGQNHLLQLILNLDHNVTNQMSHFTQIYTAMADRINALDLGSSSQILPSINSDPLWPKGTYGLFNTNSGCPDNTHGVTWFEGYRRHHTEESHNKDRVSVVSHLAPPVTDVTDKNHFFFQRFCVVNATGQGPDWPSGTYCINRKGGTCPTGFNSGYLFIDDSTNNLQTIFGEMPDGRYTDHTLLYYCCRKDGPVATPITLPTTTPFFLYRYSGTCQQVRNMTLQEEYLQLDTNNEDNEDRFENTFHPDGHLDDFRIELCYYS